MKFKNLRIALGIAIPVLDLIGLLLLGTNAKYDVGYDLTPYALGCIALGIILLLVQNRIYKNDTKKNGDK